MSSNFDEVIGELKEIKKKEEEVWQKDIVKSTISALLSIEKESLYGSLRAKNKRIDEIITSAINRNKE